MRIALLEDDPSQLELYGHWVALESHDPHRFECGQDLLNALTQGRFDLLILDWNLPDMSGLEVLKRIRQSSNVPVIFCTARESEDSVVSVLRAGANDYIRKPVRRRELLARIQAVVRRATIEDVEPDSLAVELFLVDYVQRTISRNGERLQLTDKDYALASFFLSNIGRLLSRKLIHEKIWGVARAGSVSSRTIDTHVCRIRGSLGLVAEHGWELKAVYGLGYRLERTNPASHGSLLRVGGEWMEPEET